MWRARIWLVLVLSIVSVPYSLAQKTKKFPGEATISDGNVNAIVSDALEPTLPSRTNTYVDGVDCVAANSQGSGQFTISTVAWDDDCSLFLARGEWRYINVPLTNPIAVETPPGTLFDLDNDGIAENVEQVPVRWGFNSPFKAKSGDAVDVRIFIIEVEDHGTIGETDRRWKLEYRDQAVVTVEDGARRVMMPVGAADLYEQVIEVRRNKGKFREWKTNVWRGAYHIPFEVMLRVEP